VALDDSTFARDISFPLRFDSECNLATDEDEEVVEQALNLITFLPQGTLPLFPDMGSTAVLTVFDPLDAGSKLSLDTSIRMAVSRLEPRVVLDKEFTIEESADELKIIAIIPYRIIVNNKSGAVRLTIPRPIGG